MAGSRDQYQSNVKKTMSKMKNACLSVHRTCSKNRFCRVLVKINGFNIISENFLFQDLNCFLLSV